MQNRIKLSFSSTSKINRPALSCKVREYYSDLLEEKLLNTNLIVLKDGWCIDLVIMFMEEAPRFKSSEIILGKGAKTVKSEKVKIYDMIIPLKLITLKGNSLDVILHTLQQALTIFYTETFKKVTLEIMDECWREMDISYLKSLPYPAPLKDQKYVGDILREDGSIYIY